MTITMTEKNRLMRKAVKMHGHISRCGNMEKKTPINKLFVEINLRSGPVASFWFNSDDHSTRVVSIKRHCN